VTGQSRPAASVRAAGPADVPEIARIQIDTWRVAYARLLPAAVLAAATPELAIAEWTAAVTRPPSPRHRVLVAREQDWTVGFVAFGPAEEDREGDGRASSAAQRGAERATEPSNRDREGILYTLLVEPRWGRRGHGSRLLAAAIDHLRQDGASRAVVWLAEGDVAATRFYESAGWQRDGAVRRLVEGGQTVREARFHVSLEGEA
jgi:GNAT superfamily N-acetyltransferase